MKNKKPKFRISIKKKFKEIMEDTNKSLSENSSDLNEEDFSWIEKEGNEEIKKLYIQFPFQKWNKILKNDFSNEYVDKGPTYQEKVCNVFKEDIFKDEDFQKENPNLLLFKEYLNKEFKISPAKKIRPDFIIKNIKKEKFQEIISANKYMFRKGINFQIPENFEYVTVLGEIKLSPKSIKSKKKQLKNYISFRNFINRMQEKVYFISMYVFDNSYINFWKKTFNDNSDIIICYMPRLYNSKYLDAFNHLSKQNDSFNKEKMIEESYPKNNIFNELDNLLEEKRNLFFSLIDIDENEENNLEKSELDKRKKENEKLKNAFNESVKSYKHNKNYLEEFRESEDNLIKNKREREDKKLYNDQMENLDKFEKLFKDLSSHRKIEKNSN